MRSGAAVTITLSKGRARPTVIAIGNLEFDIAGSPVVGVVVSPLDQALRLFQRSIPCGQLREDSGLIAKTGADFENAVVGLDVEQIGH